MLHELVAEDTDKADEVVEKVVDNVVNVDTVVVLVVEVAVVVD